MINKNQGKLKLCYPKIIGPGPANLEYIWELDVQATTQPQENKTEK